MIFDVDPLLLNFVKSRTECATQFGFNNVPDCFFDEFSRSLFCSIVLK